MKFRSEWTVFRFTQGPVSSGFTVVSEFIHLGTMFQRTGSFKKNKVNLAEKASKAMYDILNKGRVHNLSVSCHLDLFDKIIIPTRYVNLWIRDMGLRKY